jgi:hypothetical protein
MRWVDTFRIFLLISLVAITLPFVFFAVQRLSGLLVGEQEWIALGLDQGPWRGKLSGFTIFFPMLAWVPLVVVIAIFFALREGSWKPLIGGLGLIGLQAAAMIIQLETVGWLIL